jgi:hypothetical protein
MFNTILKIICFVNLNTTNTVCLTFFFKGAGRRSHCPAEPSETETLYTQELHLAYMACGADGGGAVRQRVYRPSMPLPDVPNRQPCVLRLVPKTTESSRVQQTPAHYYCMLPKSWSAEHSHVDDKVGHQLLYAIEQGRLVEAARLDKCGGPLLVCVQLVAKAAPLSVDRMEPVERMSEGRILLHVPPAPQQPEWKPQLMGVQQTCACFYEEEQFFSPRYRLMWRRPNCI